MRIFFLSILAVASILVGCAPKPAEPAAAPPAEPDRAAMIALGKRLAITGGCHDCHSPKVFGPEGPVPDESRLLSGHPQGEVLPAVPEHDGPWAIHATPTLTAWSGPWGTDFAANLTPDTETGLANYTEATFIQAMRTGKRFGSGRPILPPMPWQMIANYPDEELKAIFAYLQSLPPIKNKVPEPVMAAAPPPQ